MKRSLLAFALACAAATAARADEGMWTYDNFPVEQFARKYGFRPSAQWLESARKSSVRLAGGCSGRRDRGWCGEPSGGR